MRELAHIIENGDNLCRKINRYIALFCGFAILFLTLLVVVDVSLRYLFNHPIPGGTEATELILPYIVFLAMGYTLAVGGHVRVIILFMRFPHRLKIAAGALDCLIGIAFFGIIGYYAWLHFWESFIILEFMMAPVKLPWWVGKFSMPVGFFAIAFQSLFILLRLNSSSNKEI